MKQQILCVLSIVSILGFTGCGRIVNWAKDNFYQGCDYDATKPDCFVRSVTVYDQFTTVAMFDALWLADQVRTDYVNLFAFRFGKSEQQKNSFLRRQLEENNHFIEFYLLSPYTIRLKEDSPLWSVNLKIDDNYFAPVEMRIVQLEREYLAFFGKHYTHFKTQYLVKFNARDINDQPLITSGTQTISLVFRSVEKEACLTWNIHDLCNLDDRARISQDENDMALEQEEVEVQI